MKQAQAPDVTGFDPARLIQEYQAGVWRYLRALGCNPSQADDLTQETFLAVLQRPFQDINGAATSSYLRKIALHALISQQRRAGKVTAVENVEELDRSWTAWIGQDNSGEALLDALKDCLQQLGERARRALQMRFTSHHSRAEIAEALDISEHGAKNLMQRAKLQLRTCIDGKVK